MARITLTTWGSFGDLHPYLAVAIALRRRGHDVTLATAAAYREKVEGEGLRFHPVRPDVAGLADNPEQVRRIMDPKKGTDILLKELILPVLEQSHADLCGACHGADLLVNHPVMYAGPIVAEQLGIPWLSVTLAPLGFFSITDPPVFPQAPGLYAIHRLGRWPAHLLNRLGDWKTRPWAAPIEDLRRRSGLAPSAANPIMWGMFSPHGNLALFSGRFSPPQPDWPRPLEVCGFPFYDKLTPGAASGLDAELLAFLEGGDPPLVFTLGTSAVMSDREFFQRSREAAARLGRRAVLLAGIFHQERIEIVDGGRVLLAPYAPHSALFPRAAAVVHQCGIGTTGQSLRAGRPVLATPYAHDQPDNAHRLARLGMARVLYPSKYTATRAAAALANLLENPSYASNAARVAAQIRAENGAEAAAGSIERALRSGL